MAIARTAFPSWERVARPRVYWATNYKRTWKGSAVTSFVSPLFYVVAMGVLLGGFVDDSTAGTDALGGAPSYLAFVAPGLAAAHAMQIATGEVTWGSDDRLEPAGSLAPRSLGEESWKWLYLQPLTAQP